MRRCFSDRNCTGRISWIKLDFERVDSRLFSRRCLAGLAVVDFGDPRNASISAQIALASPATEVAAAGPLAYVSAGRDLALGLANERAALKPTSVHNWRAVARAFQGLGNQTKADQAHARAQSLLAA